MDMHGALTFPTRFPTRLTWQPPNQWLETEHVTSQELLPSLADTLGPSMGLKFGLLVHACSIDHVEGCGSRKPG